MDLNLYAGLAVVASVFAGGFAYLVYSMRPSAVENRRLAVLLALISATFIGVAGLYSTTDPTAVVPWFAVIMTVWFATVPASLRFCAVFDSPFAKPLRTRWMDTILVALMVGAPLLWFAFGHRFVVGVASFAPVVPYRPVYTVWWDHWNEFLLFTFAFSSIVALTAWGRAPQGSTRRNQLALYAAASVTCDILNLGKNMLQVHLNAQVREGTVPPLWELKLALAASSIPYIVFFVLLSYAILKAQLFDVDLRIKWTISKGTVAAVFVAAFFIVSELASNLLSSQFGTIAGVLGAGLLVFALAPLNRVAERVANSAMPKVTASEEYLSFRKLEVYKGAVEEMLVDGNLSAKDLAVLSGMRRRLGMTDAAAAAIERDVLAQRLGQAASGGRADA